MGNQSEDISNHSGGHNDGHDYKFIPDVYEHFVTHEHIVLQAIGKPKMLKCHATAQSLVVQNVLTRKSLEKGIQEQIANDAERLITLFLARSLLTVAPPKDKTPAYQENCASKNELILNLEFIADSLLGAAGPQLLKNIGFTDLIPHFTRTETSDTKPLNALIADLVSFRGNMGHILKRIQTFTQNDTSLLKSLKVSKQDQLGVVKAINGLLAARHHSNQKNAEDRTLTASHHDTLNTLSNLITIISLVHEYFADLKETISINLTVAENSVIQEIASMSDAEGYKSVSLQVLMKNIRCTDDRTKIMILNRISTIVNSLNDSFFLTELGKETINYKIREFSDSLIKSEDRFSVFVKNRL